jgi:hypothetical protein
MSLASTPASRWAVSARTNGEVLTAGITRSELELVVLGIPGGFSQPEIEGWLHDLAGVAVETSRADSRSRAIPALMHHALTGLLFSHAELWDRLDAPRPCSSAFVDLPDGAAFGWFGDATVHVLVDGDLVEPQWVRVRDEQGREARAAVFAPGTDVVVTLHYWPNGEDGNAAPASIEAEWSGENHDSRPGAEWPGAHESAAKPAGEITPAWSAAAGAQSAPVEPPAADEPVGPAAEPGPVPFELYPELPDTLPVQQPGLAVSASELPREPLAQPAPMPGTSGTAPGDPGRAAPAPLAAAPPAPARETTPAPEPKAAHPVARWLSRVMNWGRSVPQEPDPAPAEEPAGTPVSAYDSLLSESVPPTSLEQTALDLAASAPAANAPPVASAPPVTSGGLQPAGIAEILGTPAPAVPSPPAAVPPALFLTSIEPSAATNLDTPSGSIAINEKLQALLREIEAAEAGAMPVISPELPAGSGDATLDIDHEPVGADESFGIPPLPAPRESGARADDRVTSIPPLPPSRSAAGPAPAGTPSGIPPLPAPGSAPPRAEGQDMPRFPGQVPAPQAGMEISPLGDPRTVPSPPAASPGAPRTADSASWTISTADFVRALDPQAAPASPGAGPGTPNTPGGPSWTIPSMEFAPVGDPETTPTSRSAAPDAPPQLEPPAAGPDAPQDLEPTSPPSPTLEVDPPASDFEMPLVPERVSWPSPVMENPPAVEPGPVTAPAASPAPPIPTRRPADAAPGAPPMLRVPLPAREPVATDPGVPAADAFPDVAPPAPPAPAAEPDQFAESAPAARRARRLDGPDAVEPSSRPFLRRPAVWAAGVVLVFIVGWLVGGFANPSVDRGGPVMAALRAIGIGAAHFTANINTSPGGALIEIDGKPQATRTPATLELPPGDHVVKLSLPGLGFVQVAMKGRNGEKLTIDEPLNGSLEILDADSSVPISVSIDGRASGYAPLKVESIAPGLHEVGFSGPGMPAWAQTVQVNVRGAAQMIARPMTAPANGVIQAQATLNDERGAAPLPGAQVYVDGELRGVTPLSIELPRGPHSLRVKYRGETAPIQVIELPGGNQRFASFNFGLDLVSPSLTLLGTTRTFTRGQPGVVSATLEGMSADDVNEAWLHVRTPDGVWRRYELTVLRGAGNPVVTSVFPESVFDRQGETLWYLSVASRQGDETFSEIQKSSLVTPGGKPASSRPSP